MTSWDHQGCAVCRTDWLSKGEINRRLGGANGGHLLYRCDVCGSFWEESPRAAYEIQEAEARIAFPHLFDELRKNVRP